MRDKHWVQGLVHIISPHNKMNRKMTDNLQDREDVCF